MPDEIDLQTQLDKLIGELAGVLAVRTVINDQHIITEIHVLAEPGKSPKQLVRDIQSAAMAALGTDIDYKLISIAQVGRNQVVPTNSIKPPDPRLKVHKILISLDGSRQETCVQLSRGDQVYEGMCGCALASNHRHHAAANASLAALRQYLGDKHPLSLLDLQRIRMAGHDCIAVAISLGNPSGENIYFGIAVIRNPDTEVQSVVNAVLSALNRPLGKMQAILRQT